MRPYAVAAAVVLAVAAAAVVWPRRAEARVLLPQVPQFPGSATTSTSTDILSPYFRFSEFAVSASAARAGIPLVLPESVKPAIRNLHDRVLYPLRQSLGRPVKITSGYRSPTVNALVGGSDTSDHPTGQAVDVNVPGMTGEQVAARILALGLPFDQVIWYGHTNHVHVSLRLSGSNRREVKYQAAKNGPYTRATPRA